MVQFSSSPAGQRFLASIREGRGLKQSARDAGVRKLLLTHLPVWNSPTRAVEEAQEVFEGPIGVAEPAYTYRIVRSGSGRPAATVGP